MAPGSLAFERFVLDPRNRQLKRDGVPVELNSRYLDALSLLVREQGQLVSKDRFLEEIWQGVPVTDEVITQCIKMLRKQLGDKASSPCFIETVPKHGYRFIATVTQADGEPKSQTTNTARTVPNAASHYSWRQFFLLGATGMIGGGVAGVIGGLLFGFAAASQPLASGTGAVSVLLVVASITILVALIGGAGVSFGIAAGRFASRSSWQWSMVGGATGGLLVGAVVKLLGLDAFNLLFGQTPGDITGATEGALLGGAVGLGAWLASREAVSFSIGRGVAVAALTGAGAGILIPLLGGRLMVGSLDLLARQISDSSLRLDQIGGLFGESGFGPISQIATGGLEGALFGGCIVGAMIVAQRSFGGTG